MSHKKTIIIDVRNPEEFRSGNVPGSLNIPVETIQSKIEEIRSFNASLILCCVSGARSQMACECLKSAGIENVKNGGSWTDVALELENNPELKI